VGENECKRLSRFYPCAQRLITPNNPQAMHLAIKHVFDATKHCAPFDSTVRAVYRYEKPSGQVNGHSCTLKSR
jgi:hypothetical protein